MVIRPKLDLSRLTSAEKRECLALLEAQRRFNAVKNIKDYAKYIVIPGVPIGADKSKYIRPGEGDDDLGECEEFYPDNVTPADHHNLLLNALQDVADGKIKNLMVFMPPGSAKSTYASVVFPTWLMGRFPQKNIIMTTYGSDLADKFGRRCRAVCKSKEFNHLFKSELTPGNRAANDWSITNGSTYMCGGILSGITGNRADGLIVDDPVKGREEADSPTIRKKTFEAYEDDLDSRLKPTGWRIIIQTRWHMNDLSGCILPDGYNGQSGWIKSRTGADWFVICLAAQCERDDDPLGRKKGEFLWTEWFPEEWWEQKRRDKGARSWGSLYQQRPTIEEGNILKSRHWRKWPEKLPPPCMQIIQVYDTAFKTNEENDYTARTTWGIFYTKGDERMRVREKSILSAQERAELNIPAIILLGQMNKKLEFPDLRDEAKQSYKDVKPDWILIEDKASGQSLIQELRRSGLPVKAVKLKGRQDKTARAHFVSGLLEQGAVWYMDRDWAQEVIEQCAAVPRGAHDDLADTVITALEWLRRTSGIIVPSDISFEDDVRGMNYDEDEPSSAPYYG